MATAGYFADLLSHLPPGRTHKTSIHTFDIHAPVERHLFNSFHINAELHATKSLLDLPPDTVIAFPDEGAAKRFSKEYAAYDQIICTKIRKGDERTISIKEGDPKGKSILIVDDLIQTGGTIMKTAELLRQN